MWYVQVQKLDSWGQCENSLPSSYNKLVSFWPTGDSFSTFDLLRFRRTALAVHDGMQN